jgi:superfamily II DNA/RNA helicase
VHRSGRTARAHRSGTAVMLIGPTDRNYYFKIITKLSNGKKIPSYKVNKKRKKSGFKKIPRLT